VAAVEPGLAMSRAIAGRTDLSGSLPGGTLEGVAASRQVAIGYLAAMLLCGSGCSDETPEELSSREDVTMEDLSDALGCDAMRGTPYDIGPFLGNDGPPFTSVEVEMGRDCYRDGRFLGRVHLFVRESASDVIDTLRPLGPASHDPACHREQLQVIAGDRWAVTRGDAAADEVRERTGGRSVPMPSGSTTFVSYFLPGVGDAEPD
jgi:hypothetical protein